MLLELARTKIKSGNPKPPRAPITHTAANVRWRVNPDGATSAPMHPREAAVELQPDFRSIARQLAPRDKSTQDDLVQEMTLATLLCHVAQTRSTYRMLAAWRGLNYLEWWRYPLHLRDKNASAGDIPEPISTEISEVGRKLNLAIEGMKQVKRQK